MKKLFFLILMCICIQSYTAQSQISKSKFDKERAEMGYAKMTPETQALTAEQFVQDKSLTRLSNNDELVFISEETDNLGYTHTRYQQQYKSIPVLGATYIVHEQAGKVVLTNGGLIKNIDIDVTPVVSEFAAKQIAVFSTGKNYTDTELIIFDPLSRRSPANYTLAYHVENPHENVFVDAKTGEILTITGRHQHATGDGYYNGQALDITPVSMLGSGYVLEDEGRNIVVENYYNQSSVPVTDPDMYFDNAPYAVDVYWGLQRTYDYYLDSFDREGYDASGAEIITAIVNHEYNDISYWVENEKTIYLSSGGGDKDANTSLDIVSHEYFHALMNAILSQSIYVGQLAALSESYADMFGVVVEHLHHPDITKRNWIIGDEFMTNPNISGLRNLADPLDTTMDDIMIDHYSNLGSDIYANSGISSHWFYLLAEGEDDIEGIGITNAAKIAYSSLFYLNSNAGFINARIATITAAEIIFGSNSSEAQQVAAAWYEVGVGNNYGQNVSSCRERDSLALLALYNQNEGIDSFQWDISLPIDEWAGVRLTEDGDCVFILDLSISGIDSMPPGITVLPSEIGDMTSMELFIAEDNNLTSLPDEIGQLESLKFLDLSNNLIESLTNSIADLDNLENLWLSGNAIEVLPADIGGLESLIELDLTNNVINGLPSSIGMLDNLMFLYIDQNNINDLTPITNLNSLLQLSASNNEITGLPGSFSGLTGLSYLNLRNNGIATFPNVISSLSGLNTLDIGENNMGNPSSTLWNLTNLNDLYLDNTGINTLTPGISAINNLILLDLSNNGLDTWGELLNLDVWVLDVSYNELNEIPSTINNLGNLIELRVGYNNISDLPTSLWGLSNLQYLGIESCGLTEFPIQTQNLAYLNELYLSDNKISVLPINIIQSINSLGRFDVRGNKLVFSQTMKDLASRNDLAFYYAPQDTILPLSSQGNVLHVNAGDSAINNVYIWHKDGAFISGGVIIGDSTYTVTSPGVYQCVVTNNIITQPAFEHTKLALPTIDDFYFDPTMLSVYPGDCDANGKVEVLDLLHWGMAFGNQGDCRENPCNSDSTWGPKGSDEWTIYVDGVNGKHQDSDGNGTVEFSDTTAIFEHYDSIRPMYTSNLTFLGDNEHELRFELLGIDTLGLDTLVRRFAIKLEKINPADTTPVKIHGAAFQLQYGGPPNILSSMYANIDNSSLGEADDIVSYQTFNSSTKTLDVGITLLQANDTIITGPVAELVIVDQIWQGGGGLTYLSANTGSIAKSNDTYPIDAQQVNGSFANGSQDQLPVFIGVTQGNCRYYGAAAIITDNPESFTYQWSTGETGSEIAGLTPGNYQVTISEIANSSSDATLNFEIHEPFGCVEVASKVFLEGPYDETTGLMHDDLRLRSQENQDSSFFPLVDPYVGTHSIRPEVLDVDGPNAIVDWIELELRENNDSLNNIIARRPALLQRDGDIVDIDGVSSVRISPSGFYSFYLAINHRNHLIIMSPSPVGIGEVDVDFTMSDSYNPSLFGQKQLADGSWTMFTGNSDTLRYDINGQDKAVWQAENGSFEDYFISDFNMDGDVNGLDKGLWDENNGFSSAVPKGQ